MEISHIEKKYAIIIGTGLLLLVFFLFSWLLWSSYSVHNDFLEAEQLYNKKQYEKAKELYKVYLEKSSTEKQRWEAWQRLQYITIQLNSNFEEGVNNLEVMEQEYSSDVEKLPIILKDMIHIYRMRGEREKNLVSLEKLLHSQSAITTDKEKIQYYRLYSSLVSEKVTSLPRGKTEFLQCIATEDTTVALWCKYELATIYMLQEKYSKAKELLHFIIKNTSSGEEVQYLSIYMLGNIAVSRGDKSRALQYFTSIKDTYPNKEAIISRIQSLQ